MIFLSPAVQLYPFIMFPPNRRYVQKIQRGKEKDFQRNNVKQRKLRNKPTLHL